MSRNAGSGRGNPPRSTRGKTARPVEVFFHDADTVYDAPIDALWDFMLKDEEFHPKAHANVLRNFEGKDLSPTSFEATYEVWRGGKWRRSKTRITDYPPVCRVVEELDGDYAGTIFLVQYWPAGKRTRVDIWARLRSDVLSARELRTHWRESYANAFKEDLTVLPQFLKKRGEG